MPYFYYGDLNRPTRYGAAYVGMREEFAQDRANGYGSSHRPRTTGHSHHEPVPRDTYDNKVQRASSSRRRTTTSRDPTYDRPYRHRIRSAQDSDPHAITRGNDQITPYRRSTQRQDLSDDRDHSRGRSGYRSHRESAYSDFSRPWQSASMRGQVLSDSEVSRQHSPDQLSEPLVSREREPDRYSSRAQQRDEYRQGVRDAYGRGGWAEVGRSHGNGDGHWYDRRLFGHLRRNR